MDLPFRLRAARGAFFAVLFHGMGLCVAAGNEASSACTRPRAGAAA